VKIKKAPYETELFLSISILVVAVERDLMGVLRVSLARVADTIL